MVMRENTVAVTEKGTKEEMDQDIACVKEASDEILFYFDLNCKRRKTRFQHAGT